MNLTTGSRVGPYEIVAPIGAGGMGEVFRARDTRIGRDVAIKILPSEVATDPDRLRRFEQEASAAGSLNHPNLVTVHDVGTHEGVPYLVMELLEGETLREKLGDTSLAGNARIPIRKAMDYAQQLASGLAAAHEKGIIHRDLKPDNVFVTRDGRLKILDFGLAKVSGANETDPAAATRARNTNPGTVLGTVGYMSPEQVRGQDTDQRTDIFSAGAILYEMVSGRRAFRGDSAADTTSAILNQDPPDLDSSSAQQVSPIVDRVIRRCLEKERAQRFESARDLAFALEAMTSSGVSHDNLAADPAPRRARIGLAIVLATLVAMALAAVLAFRAGRASFKQQRMTFTQLTFDAAVDTTPSISPDGKTFAFVKGIAPQRRIFLQRVDGSGAIALSRSAGHDDRDPAFSPDGSQIAFHTSRDGGGIFVMGATGESVRRITSAGFNPSWSPDGAELVFASEEAISPTSRSSVSTLSIVNVSTGTVRVVSRGDAMQPRFSPRGKRVLYWGLRGRGGQRDLFTIAVSGDARSIVAATNDGALDWNAVWAPDGESILFSSDRGGTMNIWRLAIDEESGQPRGEPLPLSVPASWAGNISVSSDGRHILYTSRIHEQEVRMGTFDPATERVAVEASPLLSGSMIVRSVEVSPDGEWVAFSTEARQEDVFVIRSDGSEMRQLTNDLYRDRGVSWAADGSRIVFYSTRGGDYDAWTIRPDGSGLTQLTKGMQVNFPLLSPDGKRLYIFDLEVGRVVELKGSIATTGDAIPPIPGTSDGFFASGWSPDGTRLVGTGWLDRTGAYVYSLNDRTLRVIREPTSEGREPDHMGFVSKARWMDDQRVLLSTRDGQLVVIDLAKKTSRGVATNVTGTAISQTARTFVVQTSNTGYDVWHAAVVEP